jgi:hypothetical protein
MTLRESSTEEECCNKIVESIPNAPISGQNGAICGEEGIQSEFGNRLGLVNQSQLARDIHAGTYIVPQRNPDFTYICSGCVTSIQLAVSPTSIVKDAQGQERIKFHTFTEKTGGSSVYQRREDVAMWNSSILASTRTDRKIVDYRPIGQAQLCFSQGDVFGFTIEAGSDVTVLTGVFPAGNRFVLNASSTLETIPECPQLSNIGLYTRTESFALTPLIHITTGKILILIVCDTYFITESQIFRWFPTN